MSRFYLFTIYIYLLLFSFVYSLPYCFIFSNIHPTLSKTSTNGRAQSDITCHAHMLDINIMHSKKARNRAFLKKLTQIRGSFPFASNSYFRLSYCFFLFSCGFMPITCYFVVYRLAWRACWEYKLGFLFAGKRLVIPSREKVVRVPSNWSQRPNSTVQGRKKWKQPLSPVLNH